MFTTSTGNRQSHYNLRRPTTKTKHMPRAIVTNYALILLYMTQKLVNNDPSLTQGYTKKQLLKEALASTHQKFEKWGDRYSWSDSACCAMFAAFNENSLITYNNKEKKWYPAFKLLEYVKYHFGPYTAVPLDLKECYDQAIEHNLHAKAAWDKKRNTYHLTKQIGREFFFQD